MNSILVSVIILAFVTLEQHNRLEKKPTAKLLASAGSNAERPKFWGRMQSTSKPMHLKPLQGDIFCPPP
jgi:hypothetical protein